MLIYQLWSIIFYINQKSTLDNEFNTIFIIFHSAPKPCAKTLMNERQARWYIFCPTCMRCCQTNYESSCLFSAKYVTKHYIDAFLQGYVKSMCFGCRTNMSRSRDREPIRFPVKKLKRLLQKKTKKSWGYFSGKGLLRSPHCCHNFMVTSVPGWEIKLSEDE